MLGLILVTFMHGVCTAYGCEEVSRLPGVVLSLDSLTLQLCLVFGYQALYLRLHALG